MGAPRGRAVKGRAALNVVLLGAPGAGKGTQAQRIKDEFGLPHVATGDILRAAASAGTEVGTRAKAYMDRGELVPDEVVVAIVAERIARDDCSDGWLLDGFPRTAPQAEALDRTICEKSLKPIDRVVYLKVSADAVVERLSGRRVCPNTSCGAAYHVTFMPPEKAGVCDRCGTEIVQRDDDKPDTVRQRLETYESRTADLVTRYRDAGVLVEIQAEGKPEDVGERVLAQLLLVGADHFRVPRARRGGGEVEAYGRSGRRGRGTTGTEEETGSNCRESGDTCSVPDESDRGTHRWLRAAALRTGACPGPGPPARYWRSSACRPAAPVRGFPGSPSSGRISG